MTDYRKLIDELLKRAPAPGRVIYVQQVREFNMQDCFEGAYQVIKPRKGYLRPDGVFVKEQ